MGKYDIPESNMVKMPEDVFRSLLSQSDDVDQEELLEFTDLVSGMDDKERLKLMVSQGRENMGRFTELYRMGTELSLNREQNLGFEIVEGDVEEMMDSIESKEIEMFQEQEGVSVQEIINDQGKGLKMATSLKELADAKIDDRSPIPSAVKIMENSEEVVSFQDKEGQMTIIKNLEDDGEMVLSVMVRLSEGQRQVDVLFFGNRMIVDVGDDRDSFNGYSKEDWLGLIKSKVSRFKRDVSDGDLEIYKKIFKGMI